MATTIEGISVEVKITCDKCGKDLDMETTSITDRNGQAEIKIEPCPDCIVAAQEKGYEECESDMEDE